jgi:hypothetical protein
MLKTTKLSSRNGPNKRKRKKGREERKEGRERKMLLPKIAA